jgi:hypothetical protein
VASAVVAKVKATPFVAIDSYHIPAKASEEAFPEQDLGHP